VLIACLKQILRAVDDELMTAISARFRYFLENVDPENGLVGRYVTAELAASLAVVGFARSC